MTHGVFIDYLPLVITIYFIQSPDLEFSPVSVAGSPNLIRSFLMTGWLALLSECMTHRKAIRALTLSGGTLSSKVGWLCTLSWYRVANHTYQLSKKKFFFQFSQMSQCDFFHSKKCCSLDHKLNCHPRNGRADKNALLFTSHSLI